jgi:hypothetical protein
MISDPVSWKDWAIFINASPSFAHKFDGQVTVNVYSSVPLEIITEIVCWWISLLLSNTESSPDPLLESKLYSKIKVDNPSRVSSRAPISW